MNLDYYLGIDIGGGSGVKIGLFGSNLELVNPEETIPTSELSPTFPGFVDTLDQKVRVLMREHIIIAVGISSTGIFTPEGLCVKASTFPLLEGNNLPATLREKWGLPLTLENDANAGGLAVWRRQREELLYWALGGGWGGVWISEEGKINYPPTDALAAHHEMHPTNEPGDVIYFRREDLMAFFSERGFDYEHLERELNNNYPTDRIFRDAQRTEIRAGRIISGKGIERIYRAHKSRAGGITVEGGHLLRLAQEGDALALQTYDLFGTLLGIAGSEVVLSTGKNEMSVYLGGQPSTALPYFEKSAENEFESRRVNALLQRCPYNGNKQNANLYGAALIAQRLRG